MTEQVATACFVDQMAMTLWLDAILLPREADGDLKSDDAFKVVILQGVGHQGYDRQETLEHSGDILYCWGRRKDNQETGSAYSLLQNFTK